ncbi:zinc metallochaperone AztD [Naumannella halotolerans]|uniref:Secreted protein n=1 Tax=Naumannella halotolerans TaxID=993414 RepID=A0A4R7J957_9ACTN|nr:zinc metallochaperone AztD [Naumannella halotolerans]TDT34040.1 hypothetical protein CLV29_1685 [Naumannella halotolerans]
MSPSRHPRITAAAGVLLGAALVSGCAGTPAEPGEAEQRPSAPVEVTGTRITVTYDGGLLVLDPDSLQPVADIALPGFLRLNPVGDAQHLFVSTAEGFQVLDTGVEVKGHGDHNHYYAGDAQLTDQVFTAPEPGHVVRHADKVALFSDGAGTVQVLDPHDVMEPPAAPVWTAPQPHHGVAVPLADGGLFVSVGDSEGRSGAAIVDAQGNQLAANDQCPDLHGEATSGNGTVLAGCTDGVLLWKDGEFSKIDSPDSYGRIGNQAGSEESEVILGDYKTDPDAELEEPTRISLVDTESEELQLVELGTSYSFRSLGRGPDGEALVLGTDGSLHVIDPDSGEVTERIAVTAPWSEPTDWQQPRPTLMVDEDIAYVTEPSTSTIHVVYLPQNKVVDSVELPQVPNEISGVGEVHAH